MSIAEFPIIDVDTHLTEAKDLWTSRAPAKWKDRVPQVKLVEGKEAWVLDGKVIAGMRAHSSVLPDGGKTSGIQATINAYDDVHPASYDMKERLRLMDQWGIWASILYPNLLGFGGGVMAQFDPELKMVCARIWNDAMAEIQEESGGRIRGMGLIPWWEPEAILPEIQRCYDMGIRGVNTNPNPHDMGLPTLDHAMWGPMFDLCGDLDLSVNFHIGSSDDARDWFGKAAWPTLADDVRLAIGGIMVTMSNGNAIANLILSGICERHPKTRFVSVESGASWIPYLLEGLDYSAKEMMPESAGNLSMLPSEYFKRQIYACFWFESRHLAHTIEQVGEDNLMFETDFPHPTCLYPNARETLHKSLAGIAPSVQRKLAFENAARLYHIALPQLAQPA